MEAETEMMYESEGQSMGAVGAVIGMIVGVGVATLVLIFVGVLGGQTYQLSESKIDDITNTTIKNYVKDALRSKGVSGEDLLRKLETRLDNLVYRSGFAVSRAQARQFIGSGFFEVNGEVVTIPSIQLKEGDIIKPVDFGKIHLREGFVLPDWLQANVKEKYVKFIRLPNLEENLENINVQSIIEFYSR